MYSACLTLPWEQRLLRRRLSRSYAIPYAIRGPGSENWPIEMQENWPIRIRYFSYKFGNPGKVKHLNVWLLSGRFNSLVSSSIWLKTAKKNNFFLNGWRVEVSRQVGEVGQVSWQVIVFWFCLFFHGDILLAKANRETVRLSPDHGKGAGYGFSRGRGGVWLERSLGEGVVWN